MVTHINFFRYWEDPWEFIPERFIENGAIIPPDHPNKQRLLVFGIGRRHCPAGAFVKNILFLFLTMMLQKFKILPAEGELKPQTDPHDFMSVFAINMRPYKVQLQLR